MKRIVQVFSYIGFFFVTEGLDDNLEGLIDDNPDVENESEGEEGEKRKLEESDLDEDLSDDDYALIEENLGIKVKRKVTADG